MDPAEWTDERERMARRIDGDMPEHDASERIPFGPGWGAEQVDAFDAMVAAGTPRDIAASDVDATFMDFPTWYHTHCVEA